MYTPIDLEALKRTTSIYRQDGVIPMIPHALSNDKLSLYQADNKIDKTMSVNIDLDDQFETIWYNIFESEFKNLKQYNYESFADDFMNPDAQYYSQLHILKQVSDWLRAKRMMQWGGFYVDSDRRNFLWEKHSDNNFSIKNIAHNIIEAHAVAANIAACDYAIQNKLTWIYKNHRELNELSAYSSLPWFHAWLAINNYGHFTSPIRRYPDIVKHRVIKAHKRWLDNPYRHSDSQFVSDLSNQMRLKIETERKMLWLEEKGLSFIKNTQKRLGRKLEVYDVKHFLRAGDKLPICIKQMLLERIQSWHMSDWLWAIMPILLSWEQELQDIIYNKLLVDNIILPKKILNTLTSHRLHVLDIPVFSMKEIWDFQSYVYEPVENEDYLFPEVSYGIEFYFKWNKILSYTMNSWKLWSLEQIKWRVRYKILDRIFQYFMK